MFAPYVTQAKFRAQMLRDRRRQAPCRVSGRPTRPIKGLNLVLAHHQRPAVARCRVGVHRSSRMAARGAITFFGPRRGNWPLSAFTWPWSRTSELPLLADTHQDGIARCLRL